MAKEILSEVKTIKLPKVILEDKFAFLGRDKYKNIKRKNMRFNRIISCYKKALVEVVEDGETYLYYPNYSFLVKF